MIGLKNCPFCNGRADVYQIPNPNKDNVTFTLYPAWRYNYPGSWVVGCVVGRDCLAYVGSCRRTFLTEQEAIDAWNTRDGHGEISD